MKIDRIERTWLILVALTLLAAGLAESKPPGWPLALTVAGLIGFKGNLVIDRYMEITSLNPRIRNVLKGFVILVALLVMISQAIPDSLRSLTTLN